MKAVSNDEDGFVLLEVLIAMAVIGIACLAFLRLSATVSKRLYQAQTLQTQTMIANNLLLTERQRKRPYDRNERGVSEDQKHGWSLNVRELEVFAEPFEEQPQLREISIEVWTLERTEPLTYSSSVISAYGNPL